jgi:hypothetical protein
VVLVSDLSTKLHPHGCPHAAAAQLGRIQQQVDAACSQYSKSMIPQLVQQLVWVEEYIGRKEKSDEKRETMQVNGAASA